MLINGCIEEIYVDHGEWVKHDYRLHNRTLLPWSFELANLACSAISFDVTCQPEPLAFESVQSNQEGEMTVFVVRPSR